jgi:hypothetical protein
MAENVVFVGLYIHLLIDISTFVNIIISSDQNAKYALILEIEITMFNIKNNQELTVEFGDVTIRRKQIIYARNIEIHIRTKDI